LHLARDLDLTDVEADVVDVAGRPVIVISRYDRRHTDEGTTRIHQEDACQALGVDCTSREAKYESQGGPSLRTFARLLAAHAPASDRRKLLALTTTNIAFGNADAHAKNLSILHHPDGSTRLAPAYDITPVTYYRGVPTQSGPKDLSDHLGMWVNGKRSVHDVTAADLIAEGSSWGIPRTESDRVVHETLDAIDAAITPAAEATGIPEPMVHFVAKRTRAIMQGHAPNYLENRRPTRRIRQRQEPPRPSPRHVPEHPIELERDTDLGLGL
jgi:serine/threonine-protein kinase HipA